MKLEIERKWLLKPVPQDLLRGEPQSMVQTSLHADGDAEERVRRTEYMGDVTYTHTLKTPTETPGVRREDETVIDELAYYDLMKRKQKQSISIVKQRYLFNAGTLTFELDHYTVPRSIWTLEVELPELDYPVPSFPLPASYVLHEVTGEKRHSNKALAKAV